MPAVLTRVPPLPYDWRSPDISGEIHRRSLILKKIRENKNLHRVVWQACAADPCLFIDDWLFTYDPREEPATIPFRLFPRQRECIYWMKARLEAKEDGVVEKSRDVGLSWLCLAFALWGWTFKKGFKVGVGSRKQELVDNLGNMDTLFEKVRFMLRNLPPEMKPHKFDLKAHAPFLRIMNPQTGAAITGEGGDNIGRGGRNSLYILDEAAFIERPEMIDAALSANCPVKFHVSTFHGSGNPFCHKRFSFPENQVFVFDWKEDPRKDEAWYRDFCARHEPWIVAQEVDHDPYASLEGVCIPGKWVRSAMGLELPAAGVRAGGLDVGDSENGDPNCLVVRRGPVVESVDQWKLANTTMTARKAWGMAREKGVEWLAYDNIGVGAGVKGELWSLQEHSGGGKMHVVGVNVGAGRLSGVFEGGKPCREMFANLKALMWWSMRRRFERTHEHVTGLKTYQPGDLIALPKDCWDLVAELSQITYEITGTGKIQIESKAKLKSRGLKSPNMADALMLAFTPDEYVRYHGFGTRLGRGIVKLGGKLA